MRDHVAVDAGRRFLVDDPAPTPPRRRRATALQVVGEILATVGVLVLGFAVWSLWWTDVVGENEQGQVVSVLEAQLAQPGAPESLKPSEVQLGDAYAIIRIPRFGANYARPVYQGTDAAELARGVGHYTTTVEAGRIGNASFAGHRTTHGKPFWDIDTLVVGDSIVIRTAAGYFVYKVTSTEIVTPSSVQVVAPVPDQPGQQPTAAMITLTSCNPKFSARERYVVHGSLAGTYHTVDEIPAEDLAVPGRT